MSCVFYAVFARALLMKTFQVKVSTLHSSLGSLSASLSNKNCGCRRKNTVLLIIGQVFVQHNNNFHPLFKIAMGQNNTWSHLMLHNNPHAWVHRRVQAYIFVTSTKWLQEMKTAAWRQQWQFLRLGPHICLFATESINLNISSFLI